MGLHNLIWMSLGMFVGSMIFGCIPLSINVSQKTMKWITTLGVGLLVGAAFIVIIPEGIHTVYGHTHGHGGGGHKETVIDANSSPVDTNTTYAYYSAQFQKWLPHQKKLLQHQEHDHSAHDHEHEHEHEEAHEHEHEHTDKNTVAGAGAAAASSSDSHGHSHSSSCGGTSGQYIGISLATGFVFMLIVERLSGGHGHGHAHSPSGPTLKHGKSSSVALTVLNIEKGDGHAHGQGAQGQDDDDIHDRAPVKFDNKATLGILIHSLVDGVALGSMSVAGNEALELIVFMAVILHKAPAAFGLASFLMYQGQPYESVRRQLFWFSVAAPVGALLTYALFSTSMWGFNVVLLSDASILGLVILFSGGTFLYTIAVHILPELQKREGDAMEWHNVAILVSGILAPYFIVPAH